MPSVPWPRATQTWFYLRRGLPRPGSHGVFRQGTYPGLRAARPLDCHSLPTQTLVDSLAVRAHGGAGLGLLGHGEGLAAQRNNHATIDGGIHDLVLLHVVEELRG